LPQHRFTVTAVLGHIIGGRGVTSARRRGNTQLGLNFTIKLPKVTRGLEAAQTAVNGGIHEASVRPPVCF